MDNCARVSGILPTYITAEEARERARAAWLYSEAVDVEIRAAARLTDADRASWDGERRAIHAWYNDVINRSDASVWLGAAAIADDAATFTQRAAAWSARARAAGAPPTAPTPPTVPGGASPDSDRLQATIRLVAVAVVALAVASALRSVRA